MGREVEIRVLCAILLSACAPLKVTVGGELDTGAVVDADTDTDADSDADADADADSDTDADADADSDTDCELGRTEGCPADSCLDVLGDNPAAESGEYWIAHASETELLLCDMETGGGGWTRTTNLDFGHAACPGDWSAAPGADLCTRNLRRGGSVSASFDSLGLAWQEVRGRAVLYMLGSPDAFAQYAGPFDSLDETYTDGLSLTYDGGSGRAAVYTYALGWTTAASTPYVCPELGGTAAPAYVGEYSCDSANHANWASSTWYDEALFGDVWFQVDTGARQAREIEGRIMGDEDSANEDCGVAELELWVRQPPRSALHL